MTSSEQDSVFSVVQNRYESASKPSDRSDEHRLTAVFEPGAMRSIIDASEATTFALLGRRDTIDQVKGSSSGGIIGACLAGGQTEEMLRTFLYRVPCPEFISFSRLILGQSIANMEFFVKDILMKEPKLDWERVRDSDIPTSILAKSAISGETIAFNDFESEEDFVEALIAATWMPRVSGRRPYSYNNHPYWDLMHPGLENAVSDSTHVLLFRNGPDKIKYSPEVVKSGVEVAEIKPARTIRRLEKRQKILKEGVKIGAYAVMEALQPSDKEVDTVYEVYGALGVGL